MVSSEMPRRSRSLRRRGPKVSLSDIADTVVEQILRRARTRDCQQDYPIGATIAIRLVIAITERAAAVGYDGLVRWCLSFHATYGCRHSGACCSAAWDIPFDSGEVARVEALPFQMASRLVRPPAADRPTV